MRLGVVLTGAGACAAASAGALTWLLDAGVSPCAVCGMQAAAWPAALYLAGYDAGRLRDAAAQAARMGRRLLRADASASAGFAARAALARPPFVSALEWMGSPLLPLDDLPLACRLLTALGAQRVLVVAPQSALRHQPDALEQASGFFVPCARELGENVGVFRIPLPETLGALSLDRILPAMDVGREAAEHGMEAALERIGMPLCRVLPFRRRLIAP